MWKRHLNQLINALKTLVIVQNRWDKIEKQELKEEEEVTVDKKFTSYIEIVLKK